MRSNKEPVRRGLGEKRLPKSGRISGVYEHDCHKYSSMRRSPPLPSRTVGCGTANLPPSRRGMPMKLMIIPIRRLKSGRVEHGTRNGQRPHNPAASAMALLPSTLPATQCPCKFTG